MFQVKFWKNRFIQINIFIVCTYILWSSVIFSICFASQGEVADKTKKPETAILIRAATPKEEFGIIYNPKTGRIFLKTTANGQFKRIDPTHTIIHEMVHIGIDKKIVKEYQLTHWEKERVVDLICSLAFGNILNNYSLQSKGEKGLDSFVNKDSIMNLPLAIKHYVKQKGDAKKESVEIIIVDKVFKGSQAEDIGLKEGDILVEYDGERITSPEKLVEAVKSRAIKEEIGVTIIRGFNVKRYVIKSGSIGIKIAQKIIFKENLPKEFQ